jgi:hypothetical protein
MPVFIVSKTLTFSLYRNLIFCIDDMAVKKDTKRHFKTEFQRSVRRRKVATSVEGVYTCRQINSKVHVVSTALSQALPPAPVIPPLAPLPLDQPPTESLEELSAEEDEQQEVLKKQAQVRNFFIAE